MSEARGSRVLPTAAVLAMLVVSAFETTVVTTVMPHAVRALGDEALYPWVFVAFLVASTASVLVAGRLADAHGRKLALVVASSFFVLGSALCAAAWSVPALIAFRVVQGLGAGAVHPIAMTVTGDLYSLEERARIQGLLTTTWGLANVVGPIVGSVLVARASFRWAFVVGVPVVLVALGLLLRTYVERERDAGVPRGGAGRALALGAAIAGVLVAVEPAAATLGFVVRALLLATALAIGALVIFAERRASAPLLPAEVFADRTVRAGFAGSLASGGLFYACTTYATLWLTTHGGEALAAKGLVGLLVGWATGSTGGVRLYVRRGLRASSGGCLVLATLALGATAFAIHRELAAAVPFTLFTAGLGLGPANSTTLVGPQSRVGHRVRGMVTSAVFATRSLGGAFLVALLGGHVEALGPPATVRFVIMTVVAAVAAMTMLVLPPPGAPPT